MDKKLGKLIVIEGCEGCGKSTILARLREYFSGNPDFLFTREPGGTEIGLQIRKIILDPKNERMSPLTELMLFYADRVQHIEEIINPARKQGINVVLDRGDPSTTAYQVFGGERHELMDEVVRLASLAWGRNLKPGMDTRVYDGIIHLDVAPEIGLARKIGQDVGGESRIDQKKLDFHKRVYAGYATMANLQLFGPWHVVDATRSKDEVFQSVLGVIKGIIDL